MWDDLEFLGFEMGLLGRAERERNCMGIPGRERKPEIPEEACSGLEVAVSGVHGKSGAGGGGAVYVWFHFSCFQLFFRSA